MNNTSPYTIYMIITMIIRVWKELNEVVEFGPISLIAIGFPDVTKLKGELLKEIFNLRKAGIIRVVGLMAVAKDQNGQLSVKQVTDLSDEERVKLSAAVGALIGLGEGGQEGMQKGMEAGAQRAAGKDFGLNQDQIRQIADGMPKGTAAGLMLVEHLWAKRFKEIAIKQDGVLLANAFITPQALVNVGAELAEGARIAEQVQYQ
jgi:uncharacterized membrane protein